MAVTTSEASLVKYMRSGDNLGGCIDGGEDYRTLSSSDYTNDLLLIKGFAGQNISDACKIVSITLVNMSTRIRTTINTVTSLNFKLQTAIGLYKGTVSGTSFTPSGNAVFGHSESTKTIESSSDYSAVGNLVGTPSEHIPANSVYVGLTVAMKKNSTTNTRGYVKNIQLSVVRTRACYVTFTGEGVTETTTMYDYSSTPDYGAVVEREGYIFCGWRSSADGNLYTIGFPQVYEQDVTFTAEWKRDEYTITATAGEGGTVTGGGMYGYGETATLKASPNTGYKFVQWSDGVTTATRTVTVTGAGTYKAVFSPICVTYDSIFNFYRWKEKGVTSSRGTVSNVTDAGFTFTASIDDAYTDYSHMFKVESGKTYTFEYDFSGGNSHESFVFFHNAEGDYSWTKLASSTAAKWNFTVPDGYSLASVRFDVNTNGETITYSNIRIYPANCSFMSDTLSVSDRTDKAKWSVPTSTRDCYKFIGWNTKEDGSGTYYTASSTYPSEDLVLYSIWQADPPKISDVQVIYGGKVVSSTNKVPAGQSYIVKCKLE